MMYCDQSSELGGQEEEGIACVKDKSAGWDGFLLHGEGPRRERRETTGELRNNNGGSPEMDDVDFAQGSNGQGYAPVYSTGQEKQVVKEGNATEYVGAPGTSAPAISRYADKLPPGALGVRIENTDATEDLAVGDAAFRFNLNGSTGRRSFPTHGEINPAPAESPIRWGGAVSFNKDAIRSNENQNRDGPAEAPVAETSPPMASTHPDQAMGADDFLPLFAYVLVSNAQKLSCTRLLVGAMSPE